MIDPNEHDAGRRHLLRGAIGASLCAAAAQFASAQGSPGTEPAKLAPQVGDELAYASWEKDGHLVAPSDLNADDAPLLVYPRDPATSVIRERSRLNQILLLRLPSDEIVAFSGICTHAACAVSEWNAVARHFVCPCHASEYDPAQRARVVSGPAPRALPALPISQLADRFVIAGPFGSAIGAKS